MGWGGGKFRGGGGKCVIGRRECLYSDFFMVMLWGIINV